MTLVCCSQGKARIYYIIPGKGGLKYKLKGQTTWKTITADEPLSYTCEDILGAFNGGKCNNKFYRVWIHHVENGIDFDYSFTTLGKVDKVKFRWAYFPLEGINSIVVDKGYNSQRVQAYAIAVINGQEQVTGFSELKTNDYTHNIYSVSRVERLDGTSQADDIAQCGGDKPTKKFTVLGESGKKYVEIEVKECPDVQTVSCIFDEKNTKSRDREFPINPDYLHCFLIENYTDMYGQPSTRVLYSSTHIETGITRLVTGVIDVSSPKGCPPPKAWIECCPNGICGEAKKCPKETVCQIDCEGFRCCYDGKGNLIKKIKL